MGMCCPHYFWSSAFSWTFSLFFGLFIIGSCCVAGNGPSFERLWEKQIQVRAFPGPLQPRHKHVAQALLGESNSLRQKRVTQRERDKGRVALRGFQWHWWQNPHDLCCVATVWGVTFCAHCCPRLVLSVTSPMMLVIWIPVVLASCQNLTFQAFTLCLCELPISF